MNIILIPTYNRPQMLLRLLKQIGNNGLCIIVNDCSTENYDSVIDYLYQNDMKFEYHFLRWNMNKVNFWQTVNFLYQRAKDYEFDYAFQLSDDMELCDNFFEKAIETYQNINDKNKICLNPMLLDEMKEQAWGDKCKNLGTIYKSQWIDNCFVAKRDYFEVLNFEVLPAVRDNVISSGVGRQITKRLLKQKKNIYMVKRSLIAHGTHESVMHKEHRKMTPLTAKI